jgi:hypothetical protein
MEKEEHRRKITIDNVVKKLRCAYPKEKLSETLNELMEDFGFQEWKEIRNILAHRSQPGRHFFQGGEHHGDVLWLNEIQIDENTTSSRYDWLTKTLTKVLSDAEKFVVDLFT